MADPGGDQVAFLFDAKLCIGCAGCVTACREANNGDSSASTAVLTDRALLAIRRQGGRFVRLSCMHCNDPACVSVCPVGAFRKQDDGAVTYRSDLCMGCRYCLLACPFSIPRYQWESRVPLVRKCELCSTRRAEGLPPACAFACPTGALKFGERNTMVQEARARMGGGGYVDGIYGMTEAGGTSLLTISDIPFANLGLRLDLPSSPLPTRTDAYLSHLPGLISTLTVMLAGLHWIVRRRDAVAARSAVTGEKA
ncbi:MAG: 4Fe-4S dicluster domain-containing protein [Candidatus Hydrogenedentota bacterium]